MVQKQFSTGAITVLASPRLISEALRTHNFAPICDFSGSKITHRPLLLCAITRFALRNWPGMPGFTPRSLFTRLAECAILSYLATFSNPQITLLDHVFELANLFNCPHSKKLSFGIYLPRFSIAQINSISHTLSQRPEFTVGLRKIRPFSKTLFFDLFRHRTPHTISKSHVHPLQHVLPAVTGPNTLGVVSTHSGYSSVASNLHGVLFGTLSSLYFQQNTSPYISHDTDTIMTPNDTGGIEIVPDHSVFCKH